jgi:hypothetical protein
MKAASWHGLYTWHIAATDQPVYRDVRTYSSVIMVPERTWNLSSQTSQCMTDIPMKVPGGYVSLIALHIVTILEADVRI